MTKVSVVIPTFRSGPGLDEAVASLDRQTLPQEELEVLLLDDGSPDDTFARIEAIAADRPHYRAFRLEPSGWPSRPRNVGITESRGDYVLFMDHDDELYPSALEEALALGVAHDADVVNGKEVRTRQPRWGLSTFAADLGDARELPLSGLLPMTPHKLYRRSFLVAHDIRFPEGPRHLWEDLFFNTDVVRHHPRVAVLSSTAFYHWRETEENNSAAADGTRLDYSGDPDYWRYLEKLLRHVSTVEPSELRDELLVQNASVRLVSQLGRRLADATEETRADVVGHVRDFLDRFVPAELDARLPLRPRTALALFRAGYVDEATSYLRWAGSLSPRLRVTAAAADGDLLDLSGTVVWTPKEPTAAVLVDDPRRGLLRAGPPELLAALDDLGLSGAPHLEQETSVTLVARHQPTSAAWALPTEAVVRAESTADGLLLPAGTFRARVDAARGAAGGPLPRGTHHVFAEAVLEGRKTVRRLESDLAGPGPAGDDRPVVADTGRRGNLLLRVRA